MPILLDAILDAHALAAIEQVIQQDGIFEDGKKTAGRTARKVKNNLQANAALPEVKGALKMVEQALQASPVFRAAALPKQFSRVMFSRYLPGMHYGSHVDDPFIDNVRTDLSFTLFLSEPDSYEGGELVLSKPDGDEYIKPAKGSLYVYPSTTLHHVAEVTSGSRLAAVGWVQSRVRLEEHRALLFDLHQALIALPDTPENQASRLHLLKAKSNLMRLWAD